MRRALLLTLAIAFAIACGDNVTEPMPDRTPAVTPAPSFATTTTEDGLSISTDKDDYQPGDVVHLTGAGWPANDVLDIRLDDEPATHEPHLWTIDVAEDGTFHDTTYLVDVGDLNVMFTLTATSRSTGRSLVVVFTDGTLTMTDASPTPFSPAQATSTGIKDLILVSFEAANNGPASNDVRVRVRSGTADQSPGAQTLVREFMVGNLANGTGSSVNWDGKNNSAALVPDGIYTVRVSNGPSAEDNANPRKRQIVLDNTNPSVAVNAISGGTKNVEQAITGTAGDLPAVAGAGLEKVEVTIRRVSDDAILTSGNATNTGTNFSTWSFTYTPTEASAQKATAKATDNAGNNTTSAVQNFTVTTADEQAPTIACTVPDQSIWYGNNVTVNCTASDEGSGLKNSSDANFSLSTNVATGVETDAAQTNSRQVCDNDDNCATAGPYTFKVDRKAPEVSCGVADGAWHATDVAIPCTASDGGSGLGDAADASFSLTTNVTPGTETNTASTNSRNIADAVGNSATAGPVSGNMVDKKAPQISCGSADGNWHAADVSIACTALDGGSGLAVAGNASFSLSTNVTAGTETNNASTDSKSVADAVGNGATAGPISGNKIDKKAPVVTLSCPASPLLLNASVTANWNATEGGSGFAGPSSGSISVPTGSIGPNSVAVSAGVTQDLVGNTSAASTNCAYTVTYVFSGFFAPVDRPTTMNLSKAGQTIPLKWRLTDAAGNGIPGVTGVTIQSYNVGCSAGSGSDLIEEYAAGSSGLQDLGDGYYQFNWKTPTTYTNTCKSIALTFGTGGLGYTTTPAAYFTFKK